MSENNRRRVVMLVDNDVRRDSRVQKEAQAIAALGWDVVLLGISPTKRPSRWRIGDARVRLIPMASPLAKRRHELRRGFLRSPLAYPPGGLAAVRRQEVAALRADLRVQRVLAADLPKRRALVRRPQLLVSRVYARLAATWVGTRADRTDALGRRRREMTSPLDRFTTSFWQAWLGDRAWRRLDPHLWDYELAFGPHIDRLRPDLIHANDFRMLGPAVRAKLRARAEGRRVPVVWDAHEFLPGIRPWQSHPRWHPAQIAHEKEFAQHADSVVTVSEQLADLLVKWHGLPQRPAVVLNAPTTAATPDSSTPCLRAVCGVGDGDFLMVYSGVAGPHRGLGLMVEVLPQLPDVHGALVVSRPDSEYVQTLVTRANELGVGERLHLVPYVPYDQVVEFLSSADCGVIPIHHYPNHEIALITKFFEYAHARLPLVVSDVRAMAQETRAAGIGEVFVAEDVVDFARALTAVKADPARYRSALETRGLLDRWTWDSQARILEGVYRDQLGLPPR
ncbi:MAG: glycosyltransferase [Nocardioides sp.]